ncbi:MAG: ABC transporter [Alphaproteobacteria bacterium CG_4_10_14_0_2_um_filter_63_37]|nr:MAG: ABC transporter [Proteobacteria bacterium CG1_02_64_396]PJA23949.1 MAG: ABC transporter [Alphaproteobacteria bacterium CG_4_10_14_0_2_um_filter_63_37]
MSQPAVALRDLYKTYAGRAVVDGVSLDIPTGRCFGLLGPNGAGKTTTFRMMTGLTPPDGGEVTILGIRRTGLDFPLRHRIGVVPQQDNLDPDLTVRQNLDVYGSYFRIPTPDRGPRINDLIAFARLESHAEQPIASLSGGMQRRLTIARALINQPDILILDEPTTGLDPQVRHLIWQQLRLLRAEGMTLLLTTHYMEEAAQLCDTVAVMDAGKILDQGTPLELIARHVEAEVVEVREYSGDELPFGPMEGVRTERVGDTLFCYTADERALLAALSSIGSLTYLHRPASLEDVFLKLTGRDLRE